MPLRLVRANHPRGFDDSGSGGGGLADDNDSAGLVPASAAGGDLAAGLGGWIRGPATPLLPQGTYDLEHAELGELSLFLVPLGSVGDEMRYEAAFA